MILSSGVDLIEIERLEDAIRRHGKRFLERIFTPGELADTGGKPISLAARFAAKEAAAKALKTGIGRISWQEIEIRSGPANEPVLLLHGAASAQAAELGLSVWSVSLSHTATQAIALVVATSP
jgi:holo-[acyl-carrier protein] synthase